MKHLCRRRLVHLCCSFEKTRMQVEDITLQPTRRLFNDPITWNYRITKLSQNRFRKLVNQLSLTSFKGHVPTFLYYTPVPWNQKTNSGTADSFRTCGPSQVHPSAKSQQIYDQKVTKRNKQYEQTLGPTMSINMSGLPQISSLQVANFHLLSVHWPG